jgi:hypothetical protein
LDWFLFPKIRLLFIQRLSAYFINFKFTESVWEDDYRQTRSQDLKRGDCSQFKIAIRALTCRNKKAATHFKLLTKGVFSDWKFIQLTITSICSVSFCIGFWCSYQGKNQKEVLPLGL